MIIIIIYFLFCIYLYFPHHLQLCLRIQFIGCAFFIFLFVLSPNFDVVVVVLGFFVLFIVFLFVGQEHDTQECQIRSGLGSAMAGKWGCDKSFYF